MREKKQKLKKTKGLSDDGKVKDSFTGIRSKKTVFFTVDKGNSRFPKHNMKGGSPATSKPSTSKQTLRNTSDDWISALAVDSLVSDRTAHNMKTKMERIEQRNAKKLKRLLRKKRGKYPDKNSRRISLRERGAGRNEGNLSRRSGEKWWAGDDRSTASLCAVDEEIDRAVNRVAGEKSFADAIDHKGRRRPYIRPVVKGKATSGGDRITDSILQPRRRDYGGLGLARPSLYLQLRDPSFVPKFEEAFSAHVDGFFGKQRTKVMKRQIEGNMLWRNLAIQKASGSIGLLSVGGKKLSHMMPDDKIEAIISAGMV